MSRLIQLVNSSTGENVGLYRCSKGDNELDSSNIEAILSDFYYLCENDELDEADALLDKNGIERVFVEQEVFVD